MIDKAAKVGRASRQRRDARQKEVLGDSQPNLRNSEQSIEILIEGEECPFCHFAELKRDGDEIVCPICGYGRRPCT